MKTVSFPGMSSLILVLSYILAITGAVTTKTASQKSLAQQDIRNQLEGTWQSLSRKVVTGPSFYDPIDELLIEPALPGFAYSFDMDGNFEQAVYQVTSNPQNHSCPSASLIWQHGKYEYDFHKKVLKLIPIKIDGRQLLSEPCVDKGVSTYMRYESAEIIFQGFEIDIDNYFDGQLKLQLYDFNHVPAQPLWLTFRPPSMLPPQVLNPVSKRSLNSFSSSALMHKYKRSVEYLTYKVYGTNEGENKFAAKPVREDQGWDYAFKVGLIGLFATLFGVCVFTIRSVK